MRLCIVGTGYVGLVSAACFAEMGNTVTCIDVNPSVVDQLNAGHVHIFEPGLEPMVLRSHADGRLNFTTRLEDGIGDADCVFICVGTPPREDGSCDLSHVHQVARQIGRTMQAPLVVVDKSTVPVGTADMVRGLILEELGRRGADIEVDVVSNPEFLKEGAAIADFMRPDRVVIGTDSQRAASLMRELYAPFTRTRDKMLFMSVRSAEMTKYASNCMLATKISFINEIALICEKVGADVREVRNGIGSDSRIGYQFIYPGVGYGGSCFPKDVKALIQTASGSGVEPMLLNAVEAVNRRQKRHMAEMVLERFAPEGGVAGKVMAMWGLAFKANTDDMREAASLSVIEELTGAGMRIRAFDPVAGGNARRILAENPLVEVLPDQYGVCDGADALLVVTEWNQFRNPDFARVKSLLTSPRLFDGRNLYQPAAMIERGFDYCCIGGGDAMARERLKGGPKAG
ncbi:MAG: UDP-glucose/GDP-mannose dehydrogenase family protein [Desulfovibrio sp.]|jgi:UDPglucose 6-dehydrogenase|nr:UDP-glucose/GDP-mannose dehydrogenase family protein [Desulfovibrio sp.]